MMTRHAARGFTLLEVLVALALMAALSLMSWRALDATERSGERLAAHADDTQGLIRVLGQLEADLQHHVGTEAQAYADTWKAPRLQLIRSEQEGRWQHVVWKLEDGRLQRASGAPSGRLPLPDPTPGFTMLENVRAFTVRGWLPQAGWTDLSEITPPAAAAGIEIAIVRHRAGVDETYRKVVLMP